MFIPEIIRDGAPIHSNGSQSLVRSLEVKHYLAGAIQIKLRCHPTLHRLPLRFGKAELEVVGKILYALTPLLGQGERDSGVVCPNGSCAANRQEHCK